MRDIRLDEIYYGPHVRHISRSFSGHDMEDDCDCPQAACGGVIDPSKNEECRQHGFKFARTLRNVHTGDKCPFLPKVFVSSLRVMRTPLVDAADIKNLLDCFRNTNAFVDNSYTEGEVRSMRALSLLIGVNPMMYTPVLNRREIEHVFIPSNYSPGHCDVCEATRLTARHLVDHASNSESYDSATWSTAWTDEIGD